MLLNEIKIVDLRRLKPSSDLYLIKLLLILILAFRTTLPAFSQFISVPWFLIPNSAVRIDSMMNFYDEFHKLSREEEGYSVICDQNGQLLFYTNGIQVWNGIHELMTNSGNIPNFSVPSTSQQCIVFSDGIYNNLFQVLSLNTLSSSGELFLFTIDMAMNNGLGDVVKGSQKQIDEGLTEQMFAIPHPCEGIWLVTHLRNSNIYRTYHFIKNELVGKIDSDTGLFSPSSNDPNNYTGAIYINSHQQLVNLNYRNMEVGEFDMNSGLIFNTIAIEEPANRYQNNLYKGAFSRDGNLFYVPVMYHDSVFIRQYNLSVFNRTSIKESVYDKHIDSLSNLSLGDLIQHNGKIFLTLAADRGGLSVINDPDSSGIKSNFEFKKYRFPNSSASAKCFPTPLVLETQPIIDFLDSTMSACTVSELSVNTTSTYDSIVWNTGEKTSIILPETSGLYKAKIYRDGCAYEDSIQVEINHNIQEDSIYICENDSLEYKGQFYSAYETIIDTVLSAEGCENIKEIKILETEVIKLNAVIGVCEGTIYTDHEGNTYGEGDVFTTIKPSSMSCDTVIRNTIKALPLPKPIIEGQQVLCFGNKTDLLLSQDYEEYMWSNQDSTRSIRVGEGVFDVLVKDSLGCEGTSRVTIIERPEWLIDVLDAIDVEGSYLLQVNGDVERMESWSISPKEELFLLAGDRLLADGKAAPGFYSLALKDDIGCLTSAIFEIEAAQKEELKQSNVLNIQANSAINRVWLPQVPERMALHHVGIYDRWGNEVFATSDESESWDGRFSGQIVSTGNYVYVLKLINDKGVEQAYVGSIMVLGGE